MSYNLINKLLGFFLFFLCVIFFILIVNYLDFSTFLIYIDIMEIFGLNVSVSFLIDFFSLFFCMIVCLISSIVMFYSLFYMGNMNSSRFVYLVFLFVFFMMILIFSGNVFSMMLGWDGLGVTSFALVIFYQNEISLKSGLVTIFMNRFGDMAMIFFLCLFFPFNSFFFMMNLIDYNLFLAIFMFFMACFTKSAQFPFMSWLPLAMTAPTPVSSLVHSSTLVTAGVYLMIRFNFFFYEDYFFNFIMMLGLFTMGLGGFMALIEMDFSKIVAFSTLSQLGLLVFILSFGEVKLCFFHLVSHAIFKSFLFMMCGIFMSLSFGMQDMRLMGVKFMGSGLFFLLILFSCLNLSGFPFTMGFMSKDILLESLLSGEINILCLIFFLLFCCFTVCYSLKLFFALVQMMKIGFSFSILELFNGSKYFLLILVLFLFWFGLMFEEMLIEDDMFSYSQDFKIIDFIIFLGGGFFFKKLDNFNAYNLMISDYFWIMVFFNNISLKIYKIGLNFNFNFFYFFNYFMVENFNYYLKINYNLLYYLLDMKNFWYLLFLMLIFFMY